MEGNPWKRRSYWRLTVAMCAAFVFLAVVAAAEAARFFWHCHSEFWILEVAKAVLLLVLAVSLYGQAPRYTPEPPRTDIEKVSLIYRAILLMAVFSFLGDAGIEAVKLMLRHH